MAVVARRALSCAGVVLLCAAEAGARCPNEAPASPACVPLASWALPTVHGDMYFPRKARAEVYAGGGFDLSLISWSNNIDSFGPSQGAVRLGASWLRGGGGGTGRDERSLVAYRLSTVVSFEGNASRRFLIPTFGTAIGGLWEAHAQHVAAAEGLLGAYLLYTRHFVLDVQGGVVVPLSTSQTLFGPKAQLTASFALW